MNTAHIQAKKSLGQHFLIDQNIAKNIVALLNPVPADVVIEIGAGKGALTHLLAQSGAKIFAVEIDNRAAQALSSQINVRQWTNVEIVQDDFLDLKLREFAEKAGKKIRLIGNLPYNITSQVLFHTFDQRDCIKDCVFMMQKEVAERLVSSPRTKEYGILAVITQTHCDVRIAFRVSPNVFIPKPKVWSSVVHCILKENIISTIDDYSFFKTLVKGTFGKRRKTLANSLKYLGIEPAGLTYLSREFLQRRPEELTVEDFITLSNNIAQHV